MVNLKTISALCLVSIIAPVYAQSINSTPLTGTLLVQRCNPDVTIDNNIAQSVVTTPCAWSAVEKEPKMQISLQIAEDVDFIAGHCTLTPGSPTNSTYIDYIAANKSASKSGSHSIIKMFTGVDNDYVVITPDPAKYIFSNDGKVSDIKFVIRNFKNTKNGDRYQANVIFWLANPKNTRTFDPKDILSCTFNGF